jgi:hypothetical protein
MVIADGVHRDPATGKFTIIGTFSAFFAQQFPARLQFTVYFAITDGIGPLVLSLRIVDSASLLDGADSSGVVYEFKTESIDLTSPLMVFEGVFGVQCNIPKPGLYHCELYADDSLLMSRRVIVHLHPVGGEAKDDE